MQDLDYRSVFALTVRYTTLSVLLTLAYHDLEIELMNVVTAFLNDNFVSDIYTEQPEATIRPPPLARVSFSIYSI